MQYKAYPTPTLSLSLSLHKYECQYKYNEGVQLLISSLLEKVIW